jgi:hypothetical protein
MPHNLGSYFSANSKPEKHKIRLCNSYLANLIIPLALSISITFSAIMAWIVMPCVLANGWVLGTLLGHVVHLLLGG